VGDIVLVKPLFCLPPGLLVLLPVGTPPYTFSNYMRVEVCAVSNNGPVRADNQDYLLAGSRIIYNESVSLLLDVAEDDAFVLAAADGVGGLSAGAKASASVVEALRDVVQNLPAKLSFKALRAFFLDWAIRTHEHMPARSGSTLVALLSYEKRWFRMHAGDSRLYAQDQLGLKRLTRDHSLREMTHNPEAPANIILNAFGAGQKVVLEFKEIKLEQKQPVWLLCTDGLHDVVPQKTIEAILSDGSFSDGSFSGGAFPNGVGSGADGCKDVAEKLLAAYAEHQGTDNVSFLVARQTR